MFGTMLRLASVLAIAIAAALSTAWATETWTQFRGSDFGRTTQTDIPELWNGSVVAWQAPLPGRGASSPVIFGDRVYLTAYTGYGLRTEDPGDEAKLERKLFCIGLSDGQVIWEKSFPAPSEKNQFTPWAVALHGFASSTPAVDETGVYVFFGAAGVMAFKHDGEELWQADCGSGTHVFGAGSSPVLHKGLVLVNASVECGHLIAFRKTDGKEVWRQSGIAESWNTPAVYQNVDGSYEVAVTIKGKIVAFSPDTGEPLWNCAGIPDYICPSIVVHDGIVFASGGRSSRTVAIKSGGKGDVTETHRLWDIGKGSNVSSAVYHDGHLYWAHEKNGIVYCVDAESGELLYEERMRPAPGLIYASPLLANGRLYYVSRENGIFVVAAKPEFELIGHTQFGEDDSLFNASPVPVADGGVLLRSDKFLYWLRGGKS